MFVLWYHCNINSHVCHFSVENFCLENVIDTTGNCFIWSENKMRVNEHICYVFILTNWEFDHDTQINAPAHTHTHTNNKCKKHFSHSAIVFLVGYESLLFSRTLISYLIISSRLKAFPNSIAPKKHGTHNNKTFERKKTYFSLFMKFSPEF